MRGKIQIIWTLLTNSYGAGFIQGKIYQGQGKYVCLPGLNCYSCPGAVGSCPLGAVQASLTGASKSIPYYALGFLLFFASILGRGVCGFLCPFGLLQDLLDKIPCKKRKMPQLLDKLRLNYWVLLIFVLGIPLFVNNQFGMSFPAFCKYICPSGTLMGGLPLLTVNEGLRRAVGWLFSWKICLLLLILHLCAVRYRFFCRYLCPLGAFYGLFNSVSLYRMEYHEDRCTHCKRCHRQCKMEIPVTDSLNDPGCVRCGDCVSACPRGAISMETPFSQGKKQEKSPQ